MNGKRSESVGPQRLRIANLPYSKQFLDHFTFLAEKQVDKVRPYPRAVSIGSKTKNNGHQKPLILYQKRNEDSNV
ncbi:MAG: hypothetical protein EZS28_033813 [Streblomastix strix]|uniref:Uncharacterized protein n=1 Tax=Streblomastix strix TaxID=222440 RepID=A0A5J4UKX1_9EUKA|nr:MAG: hypothetical protein EZS28_033813 [Streblomastix strix]